MSPPLFICTLCSREQLLVLQNLLAIITWRFGTYDISTISQNIASIGNILG